MKSIVPSHQDKIAVSVEEYGLGGKTHSSKIHEFRIITLHWPSPSAANSISITERSIDSMSD